MKKLSLILLSFLLASPYMDAATITQYGNMTITYNYVTTTTSTTTTSSTTTTTLAGIAISTWTAAGSGVGHTNVTTPAINTTGANFIYAITSVYENAGTFGDSKSNGWTKINTSTNVADGIYLTAYWCQGCTTDVAQTFTVTGQYPSVAILAFSNLPSTPFDSQNSTGTAVSGVIQPGSVTPSQDNELLITGVTNGDAGSAYSIDSGFTITNQVVLNGSTNWGLGAAYIIKGAGTSGVAVNPTWTLAGGTNNMAANIAVFK